METLHSAMQTRTDLTVVDGTRLPRATLGRVALVAPLSLLFVVGVIEAGRSALISYQLSSAAQAGARSGTLRLTATSDIQSAVDNTLKPQGITGAITTVKVDGVLEDAATAKAGDDITVTVALPISHVTWLPGAQYLKGHLSGQYTVRRE